MDEGDDASQEGFLVRSLFRTDSDESEDIEQHSHAADEELVTELPTNDGLVRYQVMDVVLEEQRVGGSIAQRLWPAAEYLAQFIMNEGDQFPEDLDWLRAVAINDNTQPRMSIVELGAGVGLTGLQLAQNYGRAARLLLTDLPEAMPLLQRNIELNQSTSNVQAQVLSWGHKDDIQQALEWVQQEPNIPLLIIASDCVYFEELYKPLEKTLAALLSQYQPAVCIIAGVRRWKRDTAFFAQLGNQSQTNTHQLQCIKIQEDVKRTKEAKREISRIYSIQWQPREKRK